MHLVIDLLFPLIFIIGSMVIGIIAEYVVRTGLKRASARTIWQGSAVLERSLRYKPFVWVTLIGLYGAITNVTFEEQVYQRIQSFAAHAVLAALILSITMVMAGLAGNVIAGYTQQSATLLSSSSMFANLARIFVFLVGGLIVFQSLGIRVTAILTALGVGGLAVALALQDTLSNLFAGIYILLSRKIRVGDFVRLESGEEGHVYDINLRHTTIRELGNNLIVIPNAKMSAAINRNYDLPEKELAVLVDVGVSYANDLTRVEQVTTHVAQETLREVPGGVSEFEPFIRYHTFADLGIRFTTILRASEFVDQYLIKHEFIKRLHHRYEEENIEWLSLDRITYAYTEGQRDSR